MIDAAGIGSLVLYQKKLKERGGELKLVNVTDNYIKKLFNIDPSAANNQHRTVKETFSAVDPLNNEKLKKDCRKVEEDIQAKFKYVFYYSPMNRDVEFIRNQFSNVNIVQIELMPFL